MNAQLSRLRRLVLKDLDPLYFNMDRQQVDDWLKEVSLIGWDIRTALQAEVLGELSNGLLVRHLKQLQYDCTFLLNALSQYEGIPEAAGMLYEVAGKCLRQLLTEIEGRYSGCLKLEQEGRPGIAGEDHRIRVLFSVEVLAYFFKLLNKAGALDAGPLARLVVALSKNFTTAKVGTGQLSSHSIINKYKAVVQTTARSVRALLLKMLRLLDEEFTVN